MTLVFIENYLHSISKVQLVFAVIQHEGALLVIVAPPLQHTVAIDSSFVDHLDELDFRLIKAPFLGAVGLEKKIRRTLSDMHSIG